MLKKFFTGLMAAALLFTTSCEHQDLTPTVGGEVTVSVNVSTPEIATRAYSDGQTANNLQYAVYHKETGKQSKTDKTTISGGRQTLEFQLTAGETYEIILWADHESAPYAVDFGTRIDQTTMTVDYSNVKSNDENLDAFYAVKEFTVNGTQTETVELRRPFAQLNIGTNDYDEALTASNYQPTKSSVTVSHVNNVMNLYTGAVQGDVTVEFDENGLATGSFPVDGYKYVAMNYVLVDTDKSLVDVEFTISDDNGINKTRALQLVPVQRNYRTNLYGSILTSDVDMNVVIAPGYDDEEQVTLPWATIGDKRYESFADAMAAVQDGQIVKLQGETTLDGVANSKLFSVDKNITIDLNGYGFVANMPDVTKNSSIFEVVNGGELTIIGEGNVKFVTKAAPNYVAAFINNLGGTVNLKGGNWTISEVGGYALLPTFVDNNSNTSSVTLNIYGGTYTFHRNLFRNFANAASHNNYATVATMNIYGGTFNGRESDAGSIWNQKANAAAPAGAGVINVYGGTFNNVVIDDEFSGVVYVETPEELVNVLKNVNTHTIYLGAGTFVADIYNGTPARKSLTIIGSEGTKFGHTATTGGQLRLDLFESFTIRNCEIIQRSGVKTWGHIVFGSGNNANGVYTLENCTFKGVGTQGIYINENTTGATYNILNCTFDGDFGSEGAITIQTNKDVNHIVNVMGCTFNNIPDTSHRIFLAKSTAGLFYDFTLNTDLKAYSADDLAMFVALGKTNIDLADGEYDVYGCAGKTLTLNGSVNAILKLSNDGEDGCDYAFGGNGTGVGNITFNGLTINTESNTGNYKGYAYMKGTFNNCNFVGAYSLNKADDFVFNGCTFDFKDGYFWTWGANSVTFDGCTFNGNSKNILAHGYASTQITINNCTFAATEVGKTGAGDPTACVEIDPAGTNVYTINFTGTNTKTDKYEGWTRIKDGSTGHTITGVQ